MKINLLREDQTEKLPHEEKDKNKLNFDDTFSQNDDDFYIETPAPTSEEEYKRPRKSRIWLYIILLLVFLLGGAFISNPSGTSAFFTKIGSGVGNIFKKSGNKVASWFRSDNNDDINTPILMRNEEEDSPEVKNENPQKAAVVETPVIRVEKSVIREVIKESTEEKILESPAIYTEIKDKIATGYRNLSVAEYIWSKMPGGMIPDHLDIAENKVNIAIQSRNPMLLQSYAGIIRQHTFFRSMLASEPEVKEDIIRMQLDAELASAEPDMRPERIWDLDVSWFDDYLQLAAEKTGVEFVMDLLDTRSPQEGILEHDIYISVSGTTRMEMMSFFQELRDIPAGYVVRSISAVYDSGKERFLTDIDMGYYERK